MSLQAQSAAICNSRRLQQREILRQANELPLHPYELRTAFDIERTRLLSPLMHTDTDRASLRRVKV